jgi:hypothetical protein
VESSTELLFLIFGRCPEDSKSNCLLIAQVPRFSSHDYPEVAKSPAGKRIEGCSVPILSAGRFERAGQILTLVYTLELLRTFLSLFDNSTAQVPRFRSHNYPETPLDIRETKGCTSPILSGMSSLGNSI